MRFDWVIYEKLGVLVNKKKCRNVYKIGGVGMKVDNLINNFNAELKQ